MSPQYIVVVTARAAFAIGTFACGSGAEELHQAEHWLAIQLIGCFRPILKVFVAPIEARLV